MKGSVRSNVHQDSGTSYDDDGLEHSLPLPSATPPRRAAPPRRADSPSPNAASAVRDASKPARGRLSAIGQAGTEPWFILNRAPCSEPPPGDTNAGYPLPRMRRGRGYEIKPMVSVESEDASEVANYLKHVGEVEDQLSLLSVFCFFQDIFQANKRFSRRFMSDKMDKLYVYSSPMDDSPWGRQQAKMPLKMPPRKVDQQLVHDYAWKLAELAQEGFLYLDHPDYAIMKNKNFRDAVLRAIDDNKIAGPRMSRWRFANDAHQPEALPTKGLSGETPVEGKVDSCGVLYFGGLFILANEVTPADVNGNKILAVPRYRMVYDKDGKPDRVALVLPHPNNFVQLEKLVASIHSLTQEAIQLFGPLDSEDVKNFGEGKAALPTAHPAVLRSFPATGVLKFEDIKYLGSSVSTDHKRFMNLELAALLKKPDSPGKRKEPEETGTPEEAPPQKQRRTAKEGKKAPRARAVQKKPPAVYRPMYDTAFALPTNICKVLPSPARAPCEIHKHRTGQCTAEPPVFSEVSKDGKDGTSIQCGHTDGLLGTAGRIPPWISMLIPISQISHLRFWPYSHLLTDRIHYLTYEDERLKNWRDKPVNEELVLSYLQQEMSSGGMDPDKGIPFDTLTLSKGRVIFFLPTWAHAGCCLMPDAGCINYRLHAYLVRPGQEFDSTHTSLSHLAYETFYQKFEGLDYQLWKVPETRCVCVCVYA